MVDRTSPQTTPFFGVEVVAFGEKVTKGTEFASRHGVSRTPFDSCAFSIMSCQSIVVRPIGLRDIESRVDVIQIPEGAAAEHRESARGVEAVEPHARNPILQDVGSHIAFVKVSCDRQGGEERRSCLRHGEGHQSDPGRGL